MMVLVKDGDLPVCKWIIGRVSEIFKGNADNVRVVRIPIHLEVLKEIIQIFVLYLL